MRFAVALIAVLALANAALGKAATNYTGFIRRSGRYFVDDTCLEFLPLGFNTWEVIEALTNALPQPPNLPADVAEFTFSTAAANNLTTVRAFAHGYDYFAPLQISPGVYNETMFRGLDHMIAVAGKYNIRLILTLSDNWSGGDSKSMYVKWSNCSAPDCFYTDPIAQKLFKDNINVIVNRVNVETGVAYKNDPTILAWNLMNEPRCDCFPPSIPVDPSIVSCQPTCATVTVQNWIAIMSTYLKALDPNHLVGIGEEGFFTNSDPYQSSNPGNGWAPITGNDFTRHTNNTNVDYGGIHLWPDLWQLPSTDFLTQWIASHANVTLAQNKPLILEEFGKSVPVPFSQNDLNTVRDPYFQAVYTQLLNSLAANGPLRGALFWKWSLTPYNQASQANYTSVGYDSGGTSKSNSTIATLNQDKAVASQDSTFINIVGPSAGKALTYAGIVPDCKPTKTVVVRNTTSTIRFNSTAPSAAPSSAPGTSTSGRRRSLIDTVMAALK